MSATQNVGALKCRRPKMSAPQNVGAHGKMSATQNVGFLLKMSALKKYSKFKSKCACINYSKSKNTSAYINVSAYKNRSASHAINHKIGEQLKGMRIQFEVGVQALTIWARRALHSALLLSPAEVLVLVLVLSF